MGDRKEKKDSWAQDGRDRKRREGRGERQWSGTAGAEEECITGPAWEQKHCLSITILIQATTVWMSVCMCVIIDFCVCACDVLGMYDFFLSLYPCICAYAFVNQRVSLPLHLCVHAHIGRGLRKRFHCICPWYAQLNTESFLHYRTKALLEALQH